MQGSTILKGNYHKLANSSSHSIDLLHSTCKKLAQSDLNMYLLDIGIEQQILQERNDQLVQF